MTNGHKVPYSSSAIDNLVAIEKEHQSYLRKYSTDEDLCSSIECESQGMEINGEYTILYPCPTLVSARETASEETLVAVALILTGSVE
jgi:hypothetical protein